MKKIETKIYVDVPQKPGFVKCVGNKTVEEVFKELKQELTDNGLLPEEYFCIGSGLRQDKTEFPEFDDIICHVNWGSNEGIYIDIGLVTEESPICFAVGKTLDESQSSFERMNYIAGYIYRLFMGDGSIHARYFLYTRKNKEYTQEKFLKVLEKEFENMMKEKLFYRKTDSEISLKEIALAAISVHILEGCHLSEDKIKKIAQKDDILKYLGKLFESATEPLISNMKEIVTSCRFDD